MTDSSNGIVRQPEMKLEDVRNARNGNKCSGRGRETAAGRGYNTERLARTVLDKDGVFLSWSADTWYDNFVTVDELTFLVECKSCVYQYPSETYGRFRIWRTHHRKLVAESAEGSPRGRVPLYFFVVYRVVDGIEREVGKVVAPVKLIDEALDNWTERTHQTMGTQQARDISWHLLFNRLNVSEKYLKSKETVDLTSTALETNQ